jgi:molybdopterin synthase sulfur carrier subunit
MSIKLVFLGRLADLAGTSEHEVGAPLEWATLVEALESDLGEWLTGEKVKVAVNGTVLADKSTLRAGEGDEVALLPPVSGG